MGGAQSLARGCTNDGSADEWQAAMAPSRANMLREQVEEALVKGKDPFSAVLSLIGHCEENRGNTSVQQQLTAISANTGLDKKSAAVLDAYLENR